MNIYLDIDGVLLANDRQPALHADTFIKHLVTHHDVYWLTTHCRSLADDPVKNVLEPFFKRETVELLYRIKPTRWDMLKTEAINFDEPFLWFDDQPQASDLVDLRKHDALESWVEVDLAADPEFLRTVFNSGKYKI